jgi:SAM-dependent methyltransferase
MHGVMSQPNSVAEYRAQTSRLLAEFPVDKAMELAVGGGSFEVVGAAEAALMRQAGLSEGQFVIDLGCGCGRLAVRLSKQFGRGISYLGTDVVPELLDYARERSDPSYRFALTEGLNIPAEDNSVDFVSAFSLFTHLPLYETLTYLREAHRVLKPYGTIIFSFHEVWTNPWFFIRVKRAELGNFEPRQMRFVRVPGGVSTYFFSRSTITHSTRRLGFETETIIPPTNINQTVAVLRKTAADN